MEKKKKLKYYTQKKTETLFKYLNNICLKCNTYRLQLISFSGCVSLANENIFKTNCRHLLAGSRIQQSVPQKIKKWGNKFARKPTLPLDTPKKNKIIIIIK